MQSKTKIDHWTKSRPLIKKILLVHFFTWIFLKKFLLIKMLWLMIDCSYFNSDQWCWNYILYVLKNLKRNGSRFCCLSFFVTKNRFFWYEKGFLYYIIGLLIYVNEELLLICCFVWNILHIAKIRKKNKNRIHGMKTRRKKYRLSFRKRIVLMMLFMLQG
jgi:hypothetical protein